MIKHFPCIDKPELNVTHARPVDHIFLALTDKDAPETEKISKSALHMQDGTIVAVAAPGRHHDIINTIGSNGIATPEEIGEAEQGFLTSNGRFVSRERALPIAKYNKQIFNKTQPEGQLFSEDLWQ